MRNFCGPRSRRLFALSTFAALLAASPSAQADFFLHSWETHQAGDGGWSFEPSVRIYRSSTNFAPDGTPYIPRNLDHFGRTQLDLEGSYGLNRRFTVFGRLSATQVGWTNLAGGSASQTALSDSLLGVNFRWLGLESSGMKLDLQATAEIPPYSNDVSQASVLPYLGNGVASYSGGATLSGSLGTLAEGRLEGSAGAAYVRRMSTFGDALHWNANLRVERDTQGFLGSVGLDGWTTLSADPLLPYSLAQLDPAGSGGSFATGSTHPRVIRANAKFGYQVNSRIGFLASYDQAISGSSAPSGTTFGLHFQLRSGGSGSTVAQATGRERFRTYRFEGKVSRTNDKLNLIRIDRGSDAGLEVSDIVFVFSVDSEGNPNDLVAKAKVKALTADEASIEVTEYLKEIWIEPGFIVRQPTDPLE